MHSFCSGGQGKSCAQTTPTRGEGLDNIHQIDLTFRQEIKRTNRNTVFLITVMEWEHGVPSSNPYAVPSVCSPQQFWKHFRYDHPTLN